MVEEIKYAQLLAIEGEDMLVENDTEEEDDMEDEDDDKEDDEEDADDESWES